MGNEQQRPLLLIKLYEELGKQCGGCFFVQTGRWLIENQKVARFGQGQGGHAFGKLGRLQLDRAKTDPRERTLGVLGHKGRYQQYDHHKPVKDVGRNIKVALVEKQEENAHPKPSPIHINCLPVRVAMLKKSVSPIS